MDGLGPPPSTYLIDACVVVKLLVDEPGDATRRVRSLTGSSDGFKMFVPQFILIEACGVLKRKWLEKKPERGSISDEAYRNALIRLRTNLDQEIWLPYDQPVGAMAFCQAAIRAADSADEQFRVDALDVLLIKLMGQDEELRTAVLVTADSNLFGFAKSLGINVWNVSTNEVADGRKLDIARILLL